MQPHQVTFYIYAENQEQVQDLQNQLNKFVRDKYNRGVLVTAHKFADTLRKYGNNILIDKFIKG